MEKWKDCAVCRGYGAICADRPTDANPSADAPSWAWCQHCGHGGHIGCLRVFWESSNEGLCPLVGCTCDCMPGMAREARLAEEGKQKKGSGAATGRGISHSGSGKEEDEGGPVTLGATGRSVSGGKKSVRFVAPDHK